MAGMQQRKTPRLSLNPEKRHGIRIKAKIIRTFIKISSQKFHMHLFNEATMT